MAADLAIGIKAAIASLAMLFPQAKSVAIPDALCLAQTLWGEARGDRFQQRLVSHVVLNRAQNRRQSVCTVVRSPHQFAGYGKPIDRGHPEWRESVEMAVLMLAVRKADVTRGANHFFDRNRGWPDWARGMRVTVRHGNHVYLRSTKGTHQ